MGDIKAIILRLRDNCQRHTQGRCESIRCHMRGGGEPHEYDKATCEDREWAEALEGANAEIERLRALNEQKDVTIKDLAECLGDVLPYCVDMLPETIKGPVLDTLKDARQQEPSHG